MVSILQALKVSILFLFIGLIPLIVALFCLAAFINDGTINFGSVVIASSQFLWLGVMAGALLIFFIGLFKAIGDITEAALIE